MVPHRAPAITTNVAEDAAENAAPDGPAPRSAATRRGGRPSRTEALQLRERILDVATGLFLTQGYGLTTIDSVARSAGISKRTFYHRFADKNALFRAVVHRVIERMRPPPGVPLVDGASLHEKLRHLAGLILRAALSPPAIALHRMIIAESARFPELARAVHAEGAAREAVSLISGLLAREIANAELTADARNFAAQQLLQLVVAMPQRRAIGLDTPLTTSELDAWADDAVRLFLDGCRGWRGRTGAPRPRPARTRKV